MKTAVQDGTFGQRSGSEKQSRKRDLPISNSERTNREKDEMGINIVGQTGKVNGKELSYREFVERFVVKSQPVLLTGLVEDWRASRDWDSCNGKPNLHFFATHFGKSKVQAANCGTKEFTDQKRIEMSISELLDQWLQDSVMDGGNASTGLAKDKAFLYLKDWHFVKAYPEYVAYTAAQFFCDDWLYLYLDNYRMHNDPDIYSEDNEITCSDYCFVYIGEKGSWTPLHADVFRSYSWSANVCGKNVGFSSLLPKVALYLTGTKALWLECIQEQNEIIFVRRGWCHQVHNLEDTISINHNWFHAYNLSWVWNLLLKDYNEAKEYIEDIKDICDDFEDLCQRNLAANAGINFYDFFFFLAHAYALPTWSKFAINIKTMKVSETLEGLEFFRLCMAWEKTYGVIYDQQNVTTPEDLVKFIDKIITELAVPNN